MQRLIDANKLIAKWKPVVKRYEGDSKCWETAYILEGVIEDVENEPTVEAEPVRYGRWMWMGEQGDSRYMCSVCKSKEDVPTCNGEPTVWEYCPNCGAKMDVETGNTYSIGKIELPTGVFRQIYDEGRKEDE